MGAAPGLGDTGLSENRGGTLFWGPYNKDPTIWGAILGSPIFGNPHIGGWWKNFSPFW